MLGFRFLKVPPTTFVMHFKNGRVVREGAGRSFFYFAPDAEIVHIPLASIDVPFVFNEVTADFQDATIQGELTYRITDPKRLAGVLDFSVDARGDHRSDDPSKLNDRLIHAAQTLARTYTQRCKLRQLLIASAQLITEISAGLLPANRNPSHPAASSFRRAAGSTGWMSSVINMTVGVSTSWGNPSTIASSLSGAIGGAVGRPRTLCQQAIAGRPGGGHPGRTPGTGR